MTDTLVYSRVRRLIFRLFFPYLHNNALKWDVMMVKILLGVCVAIGFMTYSDEIKYKFVESGWRDRIVSNLISLDHTNKPSNYGVRSSSMYSSYN